jgi:hypothetical protein
MPPYTAFTETRQSRKRRGKRASLPDPVAGAIARGPFNHERAAVHPLKIMAQQRRFNAQPSARNRSCGRMAL